MATSPKDLAAVESDVVAYLEKHEQKSLLRFITCGSVDDGKSTLIGRLLYDSQMLYEDQLSSLEQDSKKMGTQGDQIDFALLVDGLAAEREQGITIDVAYRFFSTDRRKFIVADTPGHEQYTRNMATGASTAQLAILLVDARAGLMTQTRRHSFICSLLGIRHIVLAVNKMDLVDYSEDKFKEIEADYRDFSKGLGFEGITCIPISALAGDNITASSENTPYYTGPSLMDHLETVNVERSEQRPFRMPVQWVNRPNLDFRGFSGTVASGSISPGDEIITIPSGQRSKVARIVTMGGDLDMAETDQAVTITLEDEIDISRGDIICGGQAPADQTDQFSAHLIWMSDEEMLPGRQYILKTANKSVTGVVTDLRNKIDVNTLEQRPGKTLGLNEIAVCKFNLSAPIGYDPYKENRATGSFILIDRQTHSTVAAGMIDHSLRRASNVVWQDLEVGTAERAAIKMQRPALLWFTGLSGAGKSTIANLVEKRLYDRGRHTYILDGDNVRHGLNKDLGFTDADRVENIRRVAETAKLMVDAGLIVLSAFISPFRTERQMARSLLGEGKFIEVFIDTPLNVAEERDVKGLYKKARAGEITNFTGIDSEYEPPKEAEIHIDTTALSSVEAAEKIIAYLEEGGYLDAE
ncbi:binfunctional sulfate adenylyltransferase subunit 1/adenylylsulfate kinase protein [Parvularcula bermudensis HTCC2503]|uniref:Multifunctional fusion protein n=1 Tax=Parvularcula bermudensis (strain ATCC BAA-594 / HTCC2503 / KCTC 12087) TaxID=314260 RepID=E0TBX8_PARBH|nr:sulfate adenylyltransferase subunit CysN [Parvularcula bermudensis]ADM08471.1 binfunctional sulfate adenylyltransferase subunit 1/adenylylsulfate kinase protein [Parvularcula bermudensis HTCC2503]